MSSNTEEMGQEIRKRFGFLPMRIIPDSTGGANKTSQKKGLTDHQILRDMNFNVVFSANPARFDRYVCVNNLLEKNRLWIDPKCKHLCDDLEKVTYKTGTTFPDVSSDKTLTHISDALGYACWHSFPVVKHTGGVTMIGR